MHANVKIMTFNLRASYLEDGLNDWEQRKNLVVKMLRKYEPNVIGTQEATREQLQFLRAELPHYRAVGEFRDDSENAESVAVFFDRKLLELVKHEDFWLSETPEIPGSKSWDSSLPRMCTWVKLRHLVSGEEFSLFNTHLDHVSRQAQIKGASLIARRMQEQIFSSEASSATNMYFTGDLNSVRKELPWQILTGSGVLSNHRHSSTCLQLEDAWKTATKKFNQVDETFHGFLGSRDSGNDGSGHIDYILYRSVHGNNWRPKSFTIIVEKEGDYLQGVGLALIYFSSQIKPYKQLQFLRAELPHYWTVGEFRDDSENAESVAQHISEGLSQLDGHEDFWLSETPEIPGSKSWDSSLPRMCTWVKLRHLVSGEEFCLFNTHLDHVSRQAQIEGASLIARCMQEQIFSSEASTATNMYFTGDLNSVRKELPWQILTGSGVLSNHRHSSTCLQLEDAWKTATKKFNQVDETFHGFLGSRDSGNDGSGHIDYILYRSVYGNNWRPKSFTIIVEKEGDDIRISIRKPTFRGLDASTSMGTSQCQLPCPRSHSDRVVFVLKLDARLNSATAKFPRRKLQRIIGPVVFLTPSAVVISLFLLSANPGPRGTPAKFTVMTFNILAAKLTNGSDSWEQRKMAVVKMLRKYEPNVIGTQEVTKEQLQFLLAEFPHYRAVGAFRDDSENPESVSVFYDIRDIRISIRKPTFRGLDASTSMGTSQCQLPCPRSHSDRVVFVLKSIVMHFSNH
ncbi:unnamed protein product [Notodromas monacha]|uniref:Endonuclease/exonuclease/phosphatase domain-containing protein n=1 Tax=Notodromas monacha TaxID=399045 RepID=A0A7R9GIW2_9CRUS|nr:unnamed protein product [Notodromas monacha]CAG0922880.1 unnamed protein product [Notodromas monacha]